MKKIIEWFEIIIWSASMLWCFHIVMENHITDGVILFWILIIFATLKSR